MTRWFAPGRINLIGEHTDYNDGFVLPLAIARGCVATVRRTDGPTLVRSAQRPGEVVEIDPGLDVLGDDVPGWAKYVAGAPWLLAQRGTAVPALDIEIDSDVPIGSGLSSSAAVVCSVTTAVVESIGADLDASALLALTRAVENDVVGAPTGGMDQLVSLRGVAGHALLCDMRSLTTTPVPLVLDELTLMVVDTRAPHRHVDGEYAARRTACEEASRRLGVAALRDVDDLDAALNALDDEVLRRRVRHVVTENARVLRTAELLTSHGPSAIGSLLTESHASMRDDFEITVPEVDLVVETLLASGALGARMTGGGFGGCVIALVPHDLVDTATQVVIDAAARAGHAVPDVFDAEPGPGAHRVSGMRAASSG